MTTRIVAIDSHTLAVAGLAGLVAHQHDLELVGQSRVAAGAEAVIAELRPDVVVVDAALPDGEGVALAAELRRRWPTLGIVLLAAEEDDDLLFRAIAGGISAVVAKSGTVDELLGALRHAAVAPTSFTASGLATALTRRRESEHAFGLSPREREMLVLLGDGLSIPAIAATMYVSLSTAKTYASRLYEKLGAVNRAQALMTAMRAGVLTHADSTRSAKVG